MGLYVQSLPYNNPVEVDPDLGRHDGFLMVGPYIFVQKTENDVKSLYISYKKASFKKAMISVKDPHQVRELVVSAYLRYLICPCRLIMWLILMSFKH